MHLAGVDWLWIGGFLMLSLGAGIARFARASRSSEEYFLAGRRNPWWLLGVSMVATTFSTDTPNLVTDLVRTHGVAGNWLWWAFLLTGLVTTFLFSRLWRRAGLTTDLGFYELRYGGPVGRFLRGFRALYLGFFFNVVILATVTLAAIKLGGVLLGVGPVETVLLAGSVTVVYSMLGGLRGVLWTDLLQFGLAMSGSVAAAVWALRHPAVGGLDGLFSNPAIVSRSSLLPDLAEPGVWVPLLLVPLAVQWWSVWYPGAEPGGGGYVAQRMLAARDERHAQGASLLFNVAHYALRPWPWILVALASLVVFPDLEALRRAFPTVEAGILGQDLAYPAMLTLLPTGLLGLVIASLLAAYMSTVSTHLNWGASYLVEDFYRPFLHPAAGDREAVRFGRVMTLMLMLASGALALVLSHALEAFSLLLQIGAGTGAIFLLRWYWWRVSGWAEVAAMGASFLVAIGLRVLLPASGVERLASWQELLVGVATTTGVWLLVSWFGPATPQERLEAFVREVRVGGPGWETVRQRARKRGVELPPPEDSIGRGLLGVLGGVLLVYGLLFATGGALAGRSLLAGLCLAGALAGGGILQFVLRSEGARRAP